LSCLLPLDTNEDKGVYYIFTLVVFVVIMIYKRSFKRLKGVFGFLAELRFQIRVLDSSCSVGVRLSSLGPELLYAIISKINHYLVVDDTHECLFSLKDKLGESIPLQNVLFHQNLVIL
jgi:hypothetical protein